MNNLYLLSYPGGMGGDFLTGQISKDSSFYFIEHSINNANNTYTPEIFLGIDFKDSLKITDDSRNIIERCLSKRNLIFSTHFIDDLDTIDLPNLKGIRLHSAYNSKLIPFYYTLLWIKRYSQIRNINNKQCYLFEQLALDAKIKNSINSVNILYNRYKSGCNIIPNKWYIYKNIDDLYLNPKDNIKEFTEFFQLAMPLDYTIIEEYFQTNIKVVEDSLNISLDNYLNKDWLNELTEWVKTTCPNYYNIE